MIYDSPFIDTSQKDHEFVAYYNIGYWGDLIIKYNLNKFRTNCNHPFAVNLLKCSAKKAL